MLPTRIYLTGFMGSGKSTVGRRLADKLGYRFLDLDEAIEAKAGRPVQAIFAEQGEASFRVLEAEALRETGVEARVVVALGGGAFAQEENLRWVQQHGTSVYLHVPVGVLVYRLQRSQVERPLLRGPDGQQLDTPALRRLVADLLAAREPYYRQADLTIDVGAGDLQDATRAVLMALRRHHAGKP